MEWIALVGLGLGFLGLILYVARHARSDEDE
jgi:hypothetical protein